MSRLSALPLGRHRITLFFRIAGLAVLLGILAACGNSSTSSGGGTTGQQNTGKKPTSNMINPLPFQQDVALNTTISIAFSEAMDPDTISSASLILISGSSSNNGQSVFTNVSYTESAAGFIATITPNADLAPNLEHTVVVTAAITNLAGVRGLPKSYKFTTVKTPDDITPPKISATLPVNGAPAVAVNRSLVMTFSEPVNITIDSDPANLGYTFTLQQEGSANTVSGTFSYSGNSATFDPTSDLSPNAKYTATIIATSVTDLIGNKMEQDYQWSFTTAATQDITPPTVSVVTPRNNAVDIPVNSVISASFDEALNASTVNTSSFTLTDGSTMVPGVVVFNGTTATFTPTTSLSTNTKYTATLTTAITDLAGNPLQADYSWSFTTLNVVDPDITPPTVTTVSPASGAIDVARNGAISADFSEALNPATVNNASFTLAAASGQVAGSVTYNGTSATFTPLAELEAQTLYTATLNASIADLAGNTMSSNYAWSFTTAAAPDTTNPEVIGKDPVDGAKDVVTNVALSVTFSEALNPDTVNSATFLLTGLNATPVAGSVRYSGSTATFTPLLALAPGVTYAATVTTGITDLAGNPLLNDVTWTFTTVAATDITPPTVIDRIPAANAVNVPVTISAISATFDEALDPSTVTSASVILTVNGFTVAGSVNYANKTITFVPRNTLAFNATYFVNIRNTVTDLAGNRLATNVTWSFRTQLPVMHGGGGGG